MKKLIKIETLFQKTAHVKNFAFGLLVPLDTCQG
jgi:hypothetical protein